MLRSNLFSNGRNEPAPLSLNARMRHQGAPVGTTLRRFHPPPVRQNSNSEGGVEVNEAADQAMIYTLSSESGARHSPFQSHLEKINRITSCYQVNFSSSARQCSPARFLVFMDCLRLRAGVPHALNRFPHAAKISFTTSSSKKSAPTASYERVLVLEQSERNNASVMVLSALVVSSMAAMVRTFWHSVV
jgi:hypothetical protein